MTERQMQRFLAARQRYIENQFRHLNPMQRQAVMTTEGPLLLLAGAGSGKTTVLINRIANLIRFGNASDGGAVPPYVCEDDVQFLESLMWPVSREDQLRADRLCASSPADPWSIIAITFTNKAADELKTRLTDILGQRGQDIWAMTFHAACCRILRSNADLLGFSSGFTIYDDSDSERIMKEIIRDMGLDDKTFPPKFVLSVISKQKDRMIGPAEYHERTQNGSDLRASHIAKAYTRYQKRLMDNNALDFDDIIYYTVRLLQEHAEVRAYYQRKFRYVLVDEYQDTNHMQYLLTSLLAGGSENICVVGDDDQSIYRFRGATIENILSFEEQYRGAKVIRLEQNYRSTQSILNAANAVISNNLGRKGKQLWTSNHEGEPIVVYEAFNEGAEADFVANGIISGAKNAGFKDFAVLYRTNAQSNALEYAFKRSGIPYRVIGGMRFFDRAEIKDMLSYLCVLNNYHDDLRLNRIINNPPRGIGAKTLETANRLAQAEGLSLYQVISDPHSYGPLEKSASKLLQFTAMLEDLSQLLQSGMALPDFYEQVLARTGYVTMLETKNTEENKTRLENVRELKSSILSYMQNAAEPSLAGFLEEIALYTDIQEYNDSDDAAVLMTMHSAKGLEFDHVYLVGFEEGLFPGMRAIGERDELEEERRLCYVAITRAKKSLSISYARQRMLYGRTNASIASRFLKEIPEELILRKGSARREYSQTNSGYTYGQEGYRQDYGYRRSESGVSGYAAALNRAGYLDKAKSAPKAPSLSLSKGDMVEHKAFGRGMVLTVLPIGPDSLLEIAFDQIGTKKLMLNTASAHMKKL